MEQADLVDQLAAHKAFDSTPREELAWLVSHGSIRQLDADGVLSQKGSTVEYLFVVISGRIALFLDRGAGRHKLAEWRAGDVTGTLPYSRLTSPPANTVAQGPAAVLAVHRDHFPELIRECPSLTSMLVHTMVDRSRSFTSSALHDEKMVSLGKLSAGLAHELNNPAAAIERSAAQLERRLEDVERAARALGASRLTDAQLAAAETIRGSCLATQLHGVRSPLEQAEREEAMADWLTEHGVDAGIAETLAETAVTFEALDRVAADVGGPALNTVLQWAAAGCSIGILASEIQDSSTRISGLVAAIKGFTHMDQATVAEPVELMQSLSNTVAVLRSKARAKSATVVLNLEPDLPRVRGFAGELNQIWANLIDNALDAIPAAGRVEVTADRDGKRVMVHVVDNGSGIAPDVRDRLFDPFVTTKKVGEGTGLGLDIVRRLIMHNDAEIDVQSEPGRTEFTVALPIADIEAPGAQA